jgi:pilus assembly protein TadC
MLAYVFLFIAASALLFQGAHLLGEARRPLGVVPAEVALPERAQRRWGERLATFGLLSMLLAFLSFWLPPLAEYLAPAIAVDGCAFGAFALYLVFFAPRVRFIGGPSGDGGH